MSAVCFIGGGGFLGTALRAVFSAQGYELLTVGRATEIATHTGERYFSLARHTLLDLPSLFKNVQLHAVIDLAHNSLPNSASDPLEDISRNLENAAAHLNFSVSAGAHLFLYISSGGTVYGDGPACPRAEDAATHPISSYGIAKLACEKLVESYQPKSGMRTIILRPSNVYGPHQKPFRGQGLVATALGQAWKGEPVRVFGSGSHIRDYLYADDFCSAVTALMDEPGVQGVFNLGSGVGMSIHQVLETIAAVLARNGITLRREQFPERPGDVVHSVLNVDKLVSLTGWRAATHIHTGVERTWAWMKNYLQEQHG